MSNETKRLTYKERLRKEFTGSGLKEMFLSAAVMFVAIYCIQSYRDGMPDLKLTMLMVVVFAIVWPVFSLFWMTMGYLVDSVRGVNTTEDPKEDDTNEDDTKEVALKASAEDVLVEESIKHKGADRV